MSRGFSFVMLAFRGGGGFWFYTVIPRFSLQSFIHPRFLDRYKKTKEGSEQCISDVEQLIHPGPDLKKKYILKIVQKKRKQGLALIARIVVMVMVIV
jgi:hypothetical protein